MSALRLTRHQTSCLRVVHHASKRAIHKPLHDLINYLQWHKEPFTRLHRSAKTVFDCRQSGGRTELVVNPAEGDYNGMYPARVYEVEMRLASRPGSVTVDGVKTDAWSYGDGLLKVAVTQPDVRKKSVLVAE